MRILMLALVLSFCFASACQAEEDVQIPAPEAEVIGLASSGRKRYAVLSTSTSQKVVQTKQKIGDYKIFQISNDTVTFSYANLIFPVKAVGFRLSFGHTQPGTTVNVAGHLDRLRAIELIAKTLSREFLADPMINGAVKLNIEGASAGAAMKQALGYLPSDKNGLMIVARNAKAKLVKKARPLTGVKGIISMDFRDAGLKPTLEVLARQAGMKIDIGPGVEGLVTILVKNRKVADILPQILAIQGEGYSAKVTGDTILVKKK
jgi:hypothetical protein